MPKKNKVIFKASDDDVNEGLNEEWSQEDYGRPDQFQEKSTAQKLLDSVGLKQNKLGN